MDVKKNGSGDGFLDVAAFILAGILFVKTADVLGYFAPPWLSNLIGFDISWLYGMVCAFLVEGMALALHFNRKAKGYKPAQIVKWTLVAISAACQVFDGYIVTGQTGAMTDEMRFGLQIGVPLIPILTFVLLILIGRLPDDGEYRAGWLERLQEKGIKNHLPSPSALWNGQQPANNIQTISTNALDAPDEQIVKANGRVKKEHANP